MKNEKYYYLVVTKSNTFLDKYLSKYNSDKFCFNCFCIFQFDKVFKKDEKLTINHDCCEWLESFKKVLNRDTHC